MRAPSRRDLDAGFPTLVRYVGLGIMLWATLIDNLERPSLIVAATGMMLFKSVVNGTRKDDHDDDRERWSHLP